MTPTPAPELNGILLVDKPAGWTSHDVVARVRRLSGQRRIGHTGTLDPAATGLLVLCLGPATRLVEYLTGHHKDYEGEIQLGVITATDDAAGDVLARAAPPPLSDRSLRDLERAFSGNLLQTPPAFSAVQVGGRRAYDAARRGTPLDLPARPVEVERLHLALTAPDRLQATVRCGPGTYIRSLARDIGESLGCGAHLASLRRTRVGGFHVEQAFTLDELGALAAAGLLGAAVRPADDGLIDFDAVLLGRTLEAEVRHGSRVAVAASRASNRARVYGTDGALVAIAEVSEAGQLRPLKVLSAP